MHIMQNKGRGRGKKTGGSARNAQDKITYTDNSAVLHPGRLPSVSPEQQLGVDQMIVEQPQLARNEAGVQRVAGEGANVDHVQAVIYQPTHTHQLVEDELGCGRRRRHVHLCVVAARREREGTQTEMDFLSPRPARINNPSANELQDKNKNKNQTNIYPFNNPGPNPRHKPLDALRPRRRQHKRRPRPHRR